MRLRLSYDMVIEDVPGFRHRIGDRVFHGSNNAMLVLGRDRCADGPAGAASGFGSRDAPGGGKGAGAAHLVVGRADKEGDPDWKKDAAFIYLSMKSKVDDALSLSAKGVQKLSEVPCAVMKSDAVRVVGRKNVLILMEDGNGFVLLDNDRAFVSLGNGGGTLEIAGKKITAKIDGGAYITLEKGKVVVDGDKIELGAGATEKLIKGNAFKTYFLGHKHPTGVGPSGPVIDPWVDKQLLSTREVVTG